MINSRDTLTLVAAIGRQASSNPVGQNTAGRNVGPVPYNYGQTYAPKTAVGMIEETHVFTPHLINQAKWGYARYNGPTFNPDQAPAYAASAMGICGLPGGQAQQTFPIVTFAGTDPPTNWGGTTANVTMAENYTALDNLQWTVGKHSFTFGGQVAWMLYNTFSATGGTTPITLAAASTETAGISKGSYTVASGTGMAYASFLIGQIDKGSFTDYSLHPEYGARFRAISPYVQDNWKVTPKLTLDLGLRWDYFPSVREVEQRCQLLRSHSTQPCDRLEWSPELYGQRRRHLQLLLAGQQLHEELWPARRRSLSARFQDRAPRQLRRHVYPRRRGGRECLDHGNTGLLGGSVFLVDQRSDHHAGASCRRFGRDSHPT